MHFFLKLLPLVLVCVVTNFFSAIPLEHALAQNQYLFLGNGSIPPMSYKKNERQIGIVVDIAYAIKERMDLNIQIKFMDWSIAQKMVLNDEADALMHINPSIERRKVFEFSEPLLQSEFSIFTLSDRSDIFDISHLAGLKVGVEEKGLPNYKLKNNPKIELVILDDLANGFQELSKGKYDAIVVDKWVGAYILADLNLKNIRISGEPIDKSYSRVAVKKGQQQLLTAINRALLEIKDDGTYAEILSKWGPKQIVFQTKAQYFKQQKVLAAIISALVIVSILVIFLTIQIRMRIRSEKRLIESEEKYSQLFNTVPDAIMIFDYETKAFIDANKAVETIYGYKREDFLGIKHSDITAEQEKSNESIQQTLDGAIENIPLRYHKHKDGSIFPVEISTGSFILNGRRVLCGVVRDITERENARKEMWKSQAILQAAMDNSQAGIAIADAPDGRLRYVNESGLGIRGKSKNEIVDGVGIDQYVSSWQILHFDGTPFRDEEVPLARALLYGETCSKEFIVRRPDQEDRIVWANAAPIKNEQGDVIAAIVIFPDITDRKKAERENKINRIRLDISHKISTMPEIDEKGICDYVLERMLELSESQVGFLGFIIDNEQTMEIHSWSEVAMAECAIKDKPIRFPIEKAGIWGEPLKNRKPIIINDYSQPHPAKKGYPEGHVPIKRFMAVPVFYGDKVVAIAASGNKPTPYDENDVKQLTILMDSMWDQIQRRRFDQEKKNLQEQMRQVQKMESIGNLAGGIAHDFNNILFPIIGMSELLIEDLPSDSLERENAEEILIAGKRGSDLVKQILAFSRQSEHKMIPTRIQTVMKEVLKLSRSTIPTNIDIKQDIQRDCSMVNADPTQIHQIAMNIITNAFHAVEDEGGEITIKLKQLKLLDPYTLGLNLDSGGYARLSVSDTGHGISEKLIDKIFDPYFTTKEQGKGTGLGLSVVYGIVKEHGGDIKVHSEIGKGSTFEIYLPLMDKNIGTQSIPEADEYRGGDERILLIDDELPIVKIEKQILERLGYQVTVYVNSLEALDTFKAKPDIFDLVISDMSMPRKTGDQIAKEMISIRPDIPIIICSGFSERLNQKRAKNIGIRGILMKPIVKSDMAQMVRDVLDEAIENKK